MAPSNEIVHNRIAMLRAERGISRRDLADALQVHYQTIGYLERGEYSPSLHLALKIAQFFDVPTEVVFSLTRVPPARAPVRLTIPRTQGRSGRRRVLLTAPGQETYRQATERIEQVERAVLAGLSDEDAGHFRDLLLRVVAAGPRDGTVSACDAAELASGGEGVSACAT